MKRLYLFSAVAVTLVSACADTPSEPALLNRQFNQVIETSRHIVEFNGNAPRDFAERVAKLGGIVESVHPAGIAVVSGLIPSNATALASASGIKTVMADVQVSVAPARIMAGQIAPELLTGATVQSQMNPAASILFSWQWNMRQIGADKAWAAGKLGSSNVAVAILDTGIDYGNLDLAGLVDLNRSKSFVPMDTDTLRHYFGASWHPTTDLQGHGTNVAAQVSSKGFAFAGVTSRTTLIAVKVMDQNGSGDLSSILNGLLHAVDVDADVVNMSIGVPGGIPKAGLGSFVSLVNRIFTYAHRNGTLVVVAAGNEADDLDHDGNAFAAYCAAPNVICVSATGPTSFTGDVFVGPWVQPDAPAVFTNFGRSSIDVAAPGGNTGGAVWSFCARHAVHPFAVSATNKGPRFPCTSGGSALGGAGTSQAAPHVAGLAALLIADRPALKGNPSAIKDAIVISSDDLGAAGTDPFYGKGRINVARALGL
jgi:subtilisin family serine protease